MGAGGLDLLPKGGEGVIADLVPTAGQLPYHRKSGIGVPVSIDGEKGDSVHEVPSFPWQSLPFLRLFLCAQLPDGLGKSPGLRLAVVRIDIPAPPLEDGLGDLLKDLVALQAMPRCASARISRVSPGLIWNMSRISLGMTIWPFGPTLTELIYFSLSAS